MKIDQLTEGIVVWGSIFPEPVKVLTVQIMGNAVKLIGQGINTNQVHQPILTAEQISQLEASPEQEPFDGDAQKFRHAIEAMRLGLAYEYDPFFALTVARVDPLPHQLEAVYDYFLKQICYSTYPALEPIVLENPYKLEFIKYLEDKSGFSLDETVPPWETKFNIFNHQPKKQ